MDRVGGAESLRERRAGEHGTQRLRPVVHCL
jgi:hypothetical protein